MVTDPTRVDGYEIHQLIGILSHDLLVLNREWMGCWGLLGWWHETSDDLWIIPENSLRKTHQYDDLFCWGFTMFQPSLCRILLAPQLWQGTIPSCTEVGSLRGRCHQCAPSGPRCVSTGSGWWLCFYNHKIPNLYLYIYVYVYIYIYIHIPSFTKVKCHFAHAHVVQWHLFCEFGEQQCIGLWICFQLILHEDPCNFRNAVFCAPGEIYYHGQSSFLLTSVPGTSQEKLWQLV